MHVIKIALMFGIIGLSSYSLAEPVLYYNFSHVDVAEQAIIEDSWMIVEDGVIDKIGYRALPADFDGETRDMEARYAIPGLIDGHAHITAGPHKLEFVDGRPTVTIESVDEITRFNALSALAYGITTVRNPGGDTHANAHYDANIAGGKWLGPSALHAGSVIQPSPFSGSAFAYPTTREAWFAEAQRQAELGMTYFKLYLGLTPEELQIGVEAAHAHGLQAIAHLDHVSWQTALEAGVDGLEHAFPTSAELLPEEHREAFEALRPLGSVHLAEWFRLVDFDGPEMQTLFATLHERQTTLNLTLLVNEMIARADDLSTLFDDSAVKNTHPENWAAAQQFMTMGAATWTSENFEMARKALVKVQEFTRRIFQADIPLLIGSDGNGAGPFMAMEMQLHIDAGIPTWDVLALATHRSAQTMGLDNLGLIAPGHQADIAFLDANPVESFETLKSVHSVLVDGHYLISDELIKMASALLE